MVECIMAKRDSGGQAEERREWTWSDCLRKGGGGRTIDAKTAIICPQALCGTISPYPTVVIVILAQYIDMPMELNSDSSSSWSGFSQ